MRGALAEWQKMLEGLPQKVTPEVPSTTGVAP